MIELYFFFPFFFLRYLSTRHIVVVIYTQRDFFFFLFFLSTIVYTRERNRLFLFSSNKALKLGTELGVESSFVPCEQYSKMKWIDSGALWFVFFDETYMLHIRG